MRSDIIVSYDVNTETPQGKRRLYKVARACKAFGQRVQYSVFECSVTEANLERLRHKLKAIIDPEQDSLRIYYLRGKREDCVEVYGLDRYVDFNGPLVV